MRKRKTENRGWGLSKVFFCSLFTVHHSPAREPGQVLIAVVILFTTIVTTVVVGITAPILAQVQLTQNMRTSSQSFYTAESLAEDLAYRFTTARQVTGNEELTIGNTTATTDVTTTGSTQDIAVAAEGGALIRAVHIRLIRGTGITFNYGTQSGNGGFVIGNNSGVYGNVYSNGNITGSNGAFVTGTAVAASSVVQSADQVNEEPVPPAASLTFGNANGTQDVAQSFEVSQNAHANSASFYIKKIGNPSNATIRLVSDNGNAPTGSVLGSATLTASQITTSYGWVTVVFPTGISLLSGTRYWIVIDASSNTNNYYMIAANSTYVNGQAQIGRYGSSWNATSPSGLDAYFRFYIGGQTSTIDNIIIGQNGEGDAWAHTVENSIIAGSNYCQTGSSNDKACDASRGEPNPQPYPVSEGNIAEWKAAAAAGTIYNGDMTISATTTLGPAEITGNLAIEAELTLTGVVYVHGTITTINNVAVKLDSSFGDGGTILLSDGRIDLANGVEFNGVPGQENSYILLLTTSTCTVALCGGGNAAINVANNAGTVILNAQYGEVYVKNGAGANEITADKVNLEPNATVTYHSGLANSVFTTGPSGGYSIDTWKETE